MSQLGDIAADFEELEKIAYAHCIADGDDAMRALEAEAEAYQNFRTLYQSFCQTVATIIEKSGNNQDEQAVEMINMQLASPGNEISSLLVDMRNANKEGMSEAALETQNAYENARNLSLMMLVIAIIFIVVGILACLFEIVKPIAVSSRKLKEIVEEIKDGKGDLTKRVEVAGRDEIGRMCADINSFIETLQGIMSQITTDSRSLDKIVNQVTGSVTAVNGSACDISAVMAEHSIKAMQIM